MQRGFQGISESDTCSIKCLWDQNMIKYIYKLDLELVTYKPYVQPRLFCQTFNFAVCLCSFPAAAYAGYHIHIAKTKEGKLKATAMIKTNKIIIRCRVN